MSYSNTTIRKAESILGYGISSVAGARTFPVIDGTVYADLFTGTPTVSANVLKKTFNGRQGTEYYNQLEVDENLKEVTITANWGSADFLAEIDELLQHLDGATFTDDVDAAGVTSKKIEDFNVSFGTNAEINADIQSAIDNMFGWYIRNPLIIGVSKEHYGDFRYF